MATLLGLKYKYEETTLAFSGASEAPLIAKDIALACLSVILISPKPYLDLWEQRKM